MHQGGRAPADSARSLARPRSRPPSLRTPRPPCRGPRAGARPGRRAPRRRGRGRGAARRSAPARALGEGGFRASAAFLSPCTQPASGGKRRRPSFARHRQSRPRHHRPRPARSARQPHAPASARSRPPRRGPRRHAARTSLRAARAHAYGNRACALGTTSRPEAYLYSASRSSRKCNGTRRERPGTRGPACAACQRTYWYRQKSCRRSHVGRPGSNGRSTQRAESDSVRF